MTEFDGRAALVTGAASGIGRAAALAFARRGARVLVCDVDEAGGLETVRTIRAAAGTAEFRRLDVTDAGAVQAAVADGVERLGRLDFALNSAGMSGYQAPVAAYPLDEWADVIRVNLTGTFYCMKYELEQMASAGVGVVVNIASVAGLRASPAVAAYTASKHGVIGLTRTASLDYARRGIRVNAVCPGLTLTPMTQNFLDRGLLSDRFMETKIPIGRLAHPDEVADAVMWLCSDTAAYVTGVALPVDGAMTEA